MKPKPTSPHLPFPPIAPPDYATQPSRVPRHIPSAQVLELPKLYLARMVIFLGFVAAGLAIGFEPLHSAWQQNMALNSAIMAILLIGAAYTFRMLWRLFPEIHWVNKYRIADPGLEFSASPTLLAPMATLLRDRRGPTVLTPVSMRSLLDSLSSRLDETRDISRYLIGLLIFMGLLGTFWGLLQTIHAVSGAISGLDVTAQSGNVFEELKRGLNAPLAGMGTSFSSSLFGLAGSLILGFLDLQAGQAQNRFYRDLEEWLSAMTDIGVDQSQDNSLSRTVRLEIEQNLQSVQGSVQTFLEEERTATRRVFNEMTDTCLLLQGQLREEREIFRKWSTMQMQHHETLLKLLERLPDAQNPGSTPTSGSGQKFFLEGEG